MGIFHTLEGVGGWISCIFLYSGWVVGRREGGNIGPNTPFLHLRIFPGLPGRNTTQSGKNEIMPLAATWIQSHNAPISEGKKIKQYHDEQMLPLGLFSSGLVTRKVDHSYSPTQPPSSFHPSSCHSPLPIHRPWARTHTLAHSE